MPRLVLRLCLVGTAVIAYSAMEAGAWNSPAHAQPIPAPRQGEPPEFPGTAERGPAIEGRTTDRPEKERHGTGSAPASIPTPKSAKDTDPCAGDAACYQRRDLQAQQEMAISAYWMTMATWVQVAFAVIGTGVAIIGTILLLRSLRLSRQATEAAADAAEAAVDANKLNRQAFINEQRAWLDIDVDIVSDLEWMGLTGRITLAITLTNVGNSPEFNVILKMHQPHYADDTIERDFIESKWGSDALFPTRQAKYDRIVMTTDRITKPVEVVIKVTYYVALDTVRHHTTWQAAIGHVDMEQADMLIRPASGNIPREKLRSYNIGPRISAD
jgi:hypothetical protein